MLEELVEHHADEEEQEMSKMAKKAMSSQELNDLGERAMARKKELNRNA